MHELSICRGLMSQLETLMDEQQASGIRRVLLQIGPLAGVEPHLLQQAFPIASRDSRVHGAELVIETVAIRIRCQCCGRESAASINQLNCRHCQSSHTQLLSGDELLLHRVELNIMEPHQGGEYV